MNESFKIETSTTPGESPFSNEKVERANNNDDVGCNKEKALAWANNCLQSHQGYSANVLVFGRNVNLSTVSNSEPPALDPTAIRWNLSEKISMHCTRQGKVWLRLKHQRGSREHWDIRQEHIQKYNSTLERRYIIDEEKKRHGED